MTNRKRWELAQQGERRCWEANREKLNSLEYQELKKRYWERLLNRVVPHDLKLDGKKILDFGCGPSGVIIYLRDGYDITGIDPLMSFYLENFPYLESCQANFVSAKIEEFRTKDKYDVVFGFNALDHVNSLSQSLKSIKNLMTSDGILILTVNSHNYNFLQFLLKSFNRILDKFHPHQYTITQFEEIIQQNGFSVISKVKLDDITYWINQQTNGEDKRGGKVSIATIRKLKTIFSPENLFYSLIKLVGIKRYGPLGEKVVYSHIAFICQPVDS